MINIVGGIGGSHGITSAITGHAHKHIYVCIHVPSLYGQVTGYRGKP